ncbi:unnamed protein product [Strongylus vulgaris]|uniref:DUF7774 domain-containing protein n=1 Tax=Strongylus vulgaris TaxID=40348 RepID=A0A3P7LDJ1_STRVU|nr:unnamed protein product [Strongylus vulgaris]
MSPQLEAVALRGLDIMKRNQLLEQTVNENEAKSLVSFFESEEPKPDKLVVALIDKALTYGVEVLLTRPDLFEDFVDNELRLFLIDASKAKRALLDCMLLHPEYVPTKWGGNILRKRQQKRQMKADAAKREPEESIPAENAKKEPEKDKSPSTGIQSALETTRNIFDYLVEAGKWAASAANTATTREKTTLEKFLSDTRPIVVETKSSKGEGKLESEKKLSEGKSESEKKISEGKSESGKKVIEGKSESENKLKQEAKPEVEKKLEKAEPKESKTAESKSEGEVKAKTEQGSFEKVAKKQIRYTKPVGKYWKYRSTVAKSPPNAAWIQDRERMRSRAKARLKRPPKKS